MNTNDNYGKQNQIYDKQTRTWFKVTPEQFKEYDRWRTRIRKREQYHGRCMCPRSKWWLCDGIESMDGRNVRMIAAATAAPEEDRVLRVAAYCRVSTDDIDQALSIHLQIQQYMKKIKENPNWKYAGCYVEMCPPTMIQMHPPCTPDAP